MKVAEGCAVCRGKAVHTPYMRLQRIHKEEVEK